MGIFKIIILLTAIVLSHSACAVQRCCLISPCTSSYCLQKNNETWISTQNFALYQYTKLVLDNGSCMPCPYNCQTCNAVSTCTTCATGFYSDPVLGCLMCSYQCLTCLSKNQIMKCSSCATGTYLNTVSYTCTNCPSGALACSSPTVISQCLVGYYKTSNSMFCLPCPSNCLSCPSSNVLCTSCNKGYYLLSSNCSPCTIVNCVACAYLSSSQVCSQCSTGYRLVSGSCSACSSNCLSCSSASTCTLCAKNYYLSGSSCAPVTTTVANCQTSSTATSCASCQVGYYLSNNKCYSCSILCTQCWGDHFGACTACTANSNLFNSMCLINNYLDSKTYQYLYSFPGQSALVTQGTPDCNKLLITGTSISLQANNLAGSQIIIYWKIFSLSPAAAYTVTLSNSKGTASSPFSTTTSPSFSYCTSNPSRQYTLGMSNSTFSSILLTNSITFSSSVQLSLQQVVAVVTACNPLCIECTATLCTQCQMNNLYTQDAYCVYACSSGYYIFNNASSTTNPKMCVSLCPFGSFPFSSTLTCVLCTTPCLSCTNDVYCLSCVSGYFLASNNTCQVSCPYRYYGQLLTQACEMCVGRCKECLSPVQCINCLSGFLYPNTQSCLDSCGPEAGITHMYANLATLRCETCDTNCLNCNYAATLCTSCISTLYLFNYTCLTVCPSGYYSDLNRVCQPCSPPCESCTGSSSTCLSCVDLYWFNLSCLTSCPVGTYEHYMTLSCLNCITACTQCYGAANNCLSCSSGYYLSGSTCANTCPLGQYGNSTSRLCETCTGYCLTCSNSTYCLSCTSNFLLNGACVAANLCPARQYADMSTLSCKSCSAICLTCNYKSSLCTSCFVNSSFPYLLDGNCLANCPLVYYYASLVTGSCQQCAIPCSTCSDAITCLSCLDGYIYSSGKCSGSCQAGSYFSGIDTGCLACQVNCLVCTVNTFCQICFSSYYIYVTSAGNNQCVKPCPSLYYPNQLSASCQKCIYPCLSCTSEVDCTACQSGILYQSRCIASCPDTTYYSSTNNACQLCLSNCLTCSQSATKCNTCKTGYYFLQASQNCLAVCPTGTYAEPITQVCLGCPFECSQCTSSIVCTACIPNQTYLSGSYCVSACLSSTYATTFGTCAPCSSKCFSCTLTASTCLSCSSKFMLARLSPTQLDCLSTCPAGYFSQSQICQQCSFPCLTCTSAVSCTSCVIGTYFYVNTSNCLLSCPSNSFTNDSTRTCIPCSSPCSTCINSTYCLGCLNSMSLLKGTCLTNCPAYYYQDAAKSCVRCSGICATCNSEYYCLTCLAGYSNDGYCYSTCPVGTFADANTRKCLPCVSPCLECSNTAKHCTKCINGLVQSQGICSTTCPIGSYNSAGVCLDCTFPCLNCSSSTQCSKCLGGYLLYMGLTCITQTTLCPNDYYKLDNTECVPYTQCPVNYFFDAQSKTCSSSCMQGKYSYKGNMSCLDACPAEYYAATGLVCLKYSDNPPASLLGMTAISFISSSILKVVVLFNQSIVWQSWSQSVYQLSLTNTRLLMSTISLNYSISNDEPTVLSLPATTMPNTISLLLPAYHLQSTTTSYPLQNPSITISLPSYTVYTYQQIFNGHITSQFGQGVCWVMLMLSLFFLLKNRLSDLYILWDTVQLLYTLLFLDIQYPPNLNQFLLGLRNVFLVFLPGLAPPSYERYQSARPFYAYSYDNSLARGAGPCLTLVVFSFSLFLLFKIAELLIRKVDRIREWAREHTWLKKIVYGMILRFRWHYISDTMFITYLPVLLFSVAELYNLTANHFFSHILCATLIIIYSAFPLFVGFKLLRHFPNISKGKHSANLRCFYRGIQRTNKFGVFLIIIRYLRKLIYALIIGVFSANPMYALPILMFTSVLMGLYILLNLPFEKKLSNAIEMGTEACIALVFLAIAIINFNNFSGNSTVNMVIGWVCCALLTVMILLLMMEVFLKTFFHLESQETDTQPKSKGGIDMTAEQLRRKAGEFFDFMFPRIKQQFNFSDEEDSESHKYSQGDSQNSQNNDQRERSLEIESQNSDEFRHYDNNSDLSSTGQNSKKQVPNYLIRCVKELQ